MTTNPQFRRRIPAPVRKRNARLELTKTADDLGTSIFFLFKNSNELCKHGCGPISFQCTISSSPSSKLHITKGT